MRKPIVFIGSSVEQKGIAEIVQSLLDYDAVPIVWTQDTFEPTHLPMESLESLLERADFAILICAGEDETSVRGQTKRTIRDNVLFELGLFIGRLTRKRTFLIAPRDEEMHLPSDLKGIYPETYEASLLASNPEAALGPACSKIKRAMRQTGLIPRPEQVAAQPAGKESEVTSAVATADPIFPTGRSFDEFQWRYYLAVAESDEALQSEVSDRFSESPFASDAEQRARWDAWQQYSLLKAGRPANVSIIREKSREFPGNPQIKETLARTLLHYGDETSAKPLLLEIVRSAAEPAIGLRTAKMAGAIGALESEGRYTADFIEALNGIPRNNDDDEAIHLQSLMSVAKSAGFEHIHKSLAEVLMSIRPEDVNFRAELASEYSDSEDHALSMVHYEAVPAVERAGMLWNNLGVAYSRMSLKGKAVASFREAVNDGNGLAGANLAQLLKEAGFFTEAEASAEQGRLAQYPHENAIQALIDIQAARAEENEKHLAAIEEAKQQCDSRRGIGRSALRFTDPDIEGAWETPDGVINLQRQGAFNYEGTLEFEREVEGGFGLLLGPRKTKELVRIDVSLRRFGSALEGEVRRTTPNKPTTLLTIGAIKRTVLLEIQESGQALVGFEIGSTDIAVRWSRQQGQST